MSKYEGIFVTLLGQAFYDIGLKLKKRIEGPHKVISGDPVVAQALPMFDTP